MGGGEYPIIVDMKKAKTGVARKLTLLERTSSFRLFKF